MINYNTIEVNPTSLEELEECIADAKKMDTLKYDMVPFSSYKRDMSVGKYRFVGASITSYVIASNQYFYTANYSVERLIEWLIHDRELSDTTLAELMDYYTDAELKTIFMQYKEKYNEKINHLFAIKWGIL